MASSISALLTLRSLSTTRAQRASARNLTALGASEVVGEGVASSSHLAQDSDAPTMPLDIDETTMSRSTSVAQADDVGIPNSNKRPRRDKGKGREKEAIIRVKEEPVVVSLSLHDAAPALVSVLSRVMKGLSTFFFSPTRTIAHPVVQLGLSSTVTGVPGHSIFGVSTLQ